MIIVAATVPVPFLPSVLSIPPLHLAMSLGQHPLRLVGQDLLHFFLTLCPDGFQELRDVQAIPDALRGRVRRVHWWDEESRIGSGFGSGSGIGIGILRLWRRR